MVEGICEAGRGGCIAITEPGVIWRDEVEIILESWHQVAEHVRRRRKAMQQHECVVVSASCLAVEDVQPVNQLSPVRDHAIVLPCPRATPAGYSVRTMDRASSLVSSMLCTSLACSCAR